MVIWFIVISRVWALGGVRTLNLAAVRFDTPNRGGDPSSWFLLIKFIQRPYEELALFWGGGNFPRSPGSQDPRFPSPPAIQVSRFPGLQLPRYPGLQAPKLPSSKALRPPGSQASGPQNRRISDSQLPGDQTQNQYSIFPIS